MCWPPFWRSLPAGCLIPLAKPFGRFASHSPELTPLGLRLRYDLLCTQIHSSICWECTIMPRKARAIYGRTHSLPILSLHFETRCDIQIWDVCLRILSYFSMHEPLVYLHLFVSFSLEQIVSIHWLVCNNFSFYSSISFYLLMITMCQRGCQQLCK